MKPTDKVTLKAFAKYVGCNYSGLSILCLRGNGKKTDPTKRILKGVELPAPISGDFTQHGKRWLGKDVIAFKQQLDKSNP
jgi:hypothetical protein